jgi:N6-adenosine-specific RNA methylase IME4
MKIVIDQAFQSLIPPLATDELAQLENNIVAEGCRDPLVVWDGVLIDGHNRYEICTRLDIPFDVVSVDLDSMDDAKLWIVRNQLGRRNISDFVRVELALIAKPLIEAKAKANQGTRTDIVQNSAQSIAPLKTRDAIADLANVSHDTVTKVEKIKAKAAPELLAAVRTGSVSINAATDVATLPSADQAVLVARGEKEILQASKDIRARRSEERRTERVQKIVEISKSNAPLGKLAARYPVLYVDPPWRYEHAISESREIENQYPTMALDDIKALPVADIRTDDCVMFLWVTSPKLTEGMELLEAWGFTYRTCAVWDKQKIGMGYYFRQQHELLLVATCGKPPTPLPANRPSSVMSFARTQHSAKPAEVAELIEAMYPDLPKLEMFCRSPRDGWDAWGNQAEAA